ncbi:MAG: excinuclease ABC subunit UvrB [Candidatus Shapirobacteria bacterium]
MSFSLVSDYQPAGDQPEAIKKLVANINAGINHQTLLGVTGSGKTFTIANVIQQTQLPTLVISHNKTLAGQLYQEFKELFPKNKVSYFVSYYDYYQPEAYIPASDTYIAKEVEINDLIDKLRLEATSNLFSGSDNIIIASVSCIYNIGDPRQFGSKVLDLKIADTWNRRSLFESLISLFYTRNELEFKRSTFRVRGESIEIWPSYADWIIELVFDDQNRIKSILERNPFSGHQFELKEFRLYPAKQFVGASGELKPIIAKIQADAQAQVDSFEKSGRILEAHRIKERVNYDMEMLQEIGYVNGIENYSIYFEDSRKTGDPPYTLIDYFRHLWGDKFLTVIDESHVSVPQIGGMYFGDLARKQNLINFGFRLESALDNRPLKKTEFDQRMSKVIYVSATPADFEVNDSNGHVVEQIIRPTGLIDPPITVRPSKNQIPDLINEVSVRAKKGERSLVITLTKKMSEELSAYLSDPAKTGHPLKVAYLHSDIETLERTEILDKLRGGDYDVLVGINLLREGLDLPEVTLVAILDAASQGFLRSRASLIQIMGRASRNIDGQVILYADTVSPAMKQATDEVNRRRLIQLKYNQDNGITPETIKKAIRPKIIEAPAKDPASLLPIIAVDPLSLTPPQRKKHIADLRKLMRSAATDLDFEQAILLRDKIKEIEKV